MSLLFHKFCMKYLKYMVLTFLNIAEAPKTAASAVLKASLGEDKYAGMNS